MPIQNVRFVSARSLRNEPHRWISVTGPVLVQMKSSARTHWPESQTSSPPSRLGNCTYLTSLVSTQGGGGVFVAVVILNARSSGCWFGPTVGCHGNGLGGGPPG